MLEYFRKATAITAEPPDKPVRTIHQVIEDIWSNHDRDYNIRCLVKRLQRIEKDMSGEARELFAAYIEGGDITRPSFTALEHGRSWISATGSAVSICE